MIDADTARQIAVETLRELGGSQEPVCESWLVKEGYVVGQRFVCGGVSAVWFFESDEIKVHRHDGKVLKLVALVGTRKVA